MEILRLQCSVSNLFHLFFASLMVFSSPSTSRVVGKMLTTWGLDFYWLSLVDSGNSNSKQGDDLE